MSKYTKPNSDEGLMRLALASILNSGIMRNKKGMLGNIIGGFIVIMIGFSLMGPIAQELNNALDCNGTSMNISIGIPDGATDSFGGGGSAHFGGYDGTVKHNKFVDAIASTSLLKTNESVLNPDCVPILPGSATATLIKIVPGFFALGIFGIALGMIYTALRSGGLIGGDDNYGI